MTKWPAARARWAIGPLSASLIVVHDFHSCEA